MGRAAGSRGSGLLLAAALLLGACSPARGVPIFLWHSVGEGSPNDVYDVPAEEFDAELGLIESYGATPITLDRLFDARAGGAPLPERAVVLTFDDGRACLHHAALPLLLKHHMVAEAFVVSGFVGADEAHRRVETDASGTHPFLVAGEIQQMVQSGAVKLEAHSVTHRDLEKLSESEQRSEIADSRTELQSRFGQPVDFFAYPFGAFTGTSRDLTQAAGFRGALSVQKGLGSRYGMLRTSLHRGFPNVVAETLARAFGPPRK